MVTVHLFSQKKRLPKYNVLFVLHKRSSVWTNSTLCLLCRVQRSWLWSDDHRSGNKMHMTEKIPLGGESWYTGERQRRRVLWTGSDWLFYVMNWLFTQWQVSMFGILHCCHTVSCVCAQCFTHLKYLVGCHLADRVARFQCLQLLQTPVKLIQSLDGQLLVWLLCGT